VKIKHIPYYCPKSSPPQKKTFTLLIGFNLTLKRSQLLSQIGMLDLLIFQDLLPGAFQSSIIFFNQKFGPALQTGTCP
jgi:hypothetical protein